MVKVRSLGSFSKTLILVFLFAIVIIAQLEYDATKVAVPANLPTAISPEFIRLVDMGFHSTVASALWAGTMPEIVDLFRGHTEYVPDLKYLMAVDPKLSYPYAFTVLTLPAVPHFDASDTIAIAVGEAGIKNADTDWRIPYYMAIDYYLDTKNIVAALKYFDIAGRTPGIPQYAERFALNFGIGTNERTKIEDLWATIRDSTNDELSKERAQAYIDRLQIFDYLEAAAKIYKAQHGEYPKTPEDLVTAKIIPEVPPDPFGFTFLFRPGGMADIDLDKPPTIAPPVLEQLQASK